MPIQLINLENIFLRIIYVCDNLIETKTAHFYSKLLIKCRTLLFFLNT